MIAATPSSLAPTTTPVRKIRNRLYSLATTLHTLGDHNECRALSEETLTRSRRVLGDDHPDTLLFAYGLAVSYAST
ncbi:tetratricopeptide repeat protein [Micromonospora sp. NPDC049374]|uniref:tetratricopeptide repeat protein n=1 Tax=Micromonospora sp. NPDC049374 TaxID=3154352 RepID=UPI0034192765